MATSPPWSMPARRGASIPRHLDHARNACRVLRAARAGHAHSVEVRLDGALVGGLYGVLLGQVFFGESMFSRERDASKVALARLAERAVVAGVQLIDCQLPTPHLRSLGSKPMPRHEFSALVARYTAGADMPLFRNALKIARQWRFSGRIRRLLGCHR